ncbi:hypothetical protein, partial [Cerasicoccus arenae]
PAPPPPPVESQQNPPPPQTLKSANITLDEGTIVARLPQLTNLPPDLLKSPDELAFFERPNADTIIEAKSVALTPTTALDESSIHTAIINGNCRSLTNSGPDQAPPPIAESTKSTKHGGASEKAGASEQLASQFSDSWDDRAPINLRAELTINGRLTPGLTLALGRQLIRPLPGGYFKVIRKLNNFAEVWPIFSTLSLLGDSNQGALELAKDTATGKPILEIHASICIEGRINDESYIKFLPADVKPDENGRFSLHRALPQGAVLLPGLSLIAEG